MGSLWAQKWGEGRWGKGWKVVPHGSGPSAGWALRNSRWHPPRPPTSSEG